MFEVIPAIDLLDGQVVRLTQGDYAQVERYQLSPAQTAALFEKAGATRIHVVDLDGAKDGKLVNLPTIKAIREAVNCTLELGGGIRSIETAELLLSIGINYLILGSILIKDPLAAEAMIRRFPNQIIAGIDAKDGFVATEGWLDVAQMKATDLVKMLNPLPLAGIIYTDIATDGTLAGPNIDQVVDLASYTHHPVIASGGVGTLADIDRLKATYPAISAGIVGKAVLGGHIPVESLFK